MPSHAPVESVVPAALRLTALPISVRVARHWVVEQAEAAGASSHVVDTLELVASELVTNAVKYGPDLGVIVVDTELRGGLLGVTVSDDSHEPPLEVDTGLDTPGGLGVELVRELATVYGFELHTGDGKTVTFRMPVDAAS